MNPEHLEIAGQGRQAIDAWRRDNVGGQLDLTRANLSDANLSDASCNNATRWPNGTKGHGSECPPAK